LFQKSVGLRILGETVIVPGMKGIARIGIDGGELLRVYGTMPHANILAGFLVIGLVSLFYLFLEEKKFMTEIVVSIGIFIVCMGLVFTFSRSGWIVAIFTIVLTLLLGFIKKDHRHNTTHLAVIIAICVALLLGVFGWAVFARAHLSSNEGPVIDRWNYDKIGIALLTSRPQGVGIGNELFYAYHNGFFADYGLNTQGQWQPIHNLFLLIGSEVGILGLVCFVFFLLTLFFRRTDHEVQFAEIMLLGMLLFGLSDHFLWDLEAGRLMLWTVLGILMGLRYSVSTK